MPASALSNPAVVTHGLTRRFGSVTAVDGIDLTVESGSVTGILGPNGAGKSTFLRMLVGLVRPSSGRATVAGVELVGDGTAVRRRVAFAPGEIALYGEMRAGEQLTWLLRGRERGTEERGRDLAKDLGLPLDKRIHEYSHGMKRQLLFVAAMAPAVPLRILDEPTEGLDPAKRSLVLELIRRDVQSGVTILLSSHHLAEVEEVCDRLVFFEAGRVLADESAADLRALAARWVRLEYPSPEAADRAAACLGEAPGIAQAASSGHAVSAEFAEAGTPFDHLALLQAAVDPPVAVELGHLSLEDLFERLYGVRGR